MFHRCKSDEESHELQLLNKQGKHIRKETPSLMPHHEDTPWWDKVVSYLLPYKEALSLLTSNVSAISKEPEKE